MDTYILNILILFIKYIKYFYSLIILYWLFWIFYPEEIKRILFSLKINFKNYYKNIGLTYLIKTLKIFIGLPTHSLRYLNPFYDFSDILYSIFRDS